MAKTVERIGIGPWMAMLRSVHAVGPQTMAVNRALVSLIRQPVTEAQRMRSEIAADVFVQRGMRGTLDDLDGLVERIGLYLEWMVAAVEAGTHVLEGFDEHVAYPILDGIWPSEPDFISPQTERGLTLSKNCSRRMPDGGSIIFSSCWRGMPDGQLAATVFNQIAAAYELEHELGTDWLSQLTRTFFSTAEREFTETSAPGEDATAIEVVRDKLVDAAEGAGKLVKQVAEATGLAAVLRAVLIGGGVVFAIWLFTRLGK